MICFCFLDTGVCCIFRAVTPFQVVNGVLSISRTAASISLERALAGLRLQYQQQQRQSTTVVDQLAAQGAEMEVLQGRLR